MLVLHGEQQLHWPHWKKMLFRFFFIFITLFITPWTWLDTIPFISKITAWYSDFEDWVVRFANDKILHVKKELVPVAGSGDTSWGWAHFYLVFLLALAGCLLWSVFDRKRKNYNKLDYWLCLFTRYYLAYFSFLYGIIKLFALQMPFPSLSMQATALGDLLPMRLSWMFMGYSTPYQVFSGAMETLAGILLLHRRTATFGTIVAAGVFLNVMVMNLSYDIPVKIFSMRLEFFSLFLLAHEKDRLFSFLVTNKTTPAGNLYDVSFTRRWMKVTRVILKLVFIGVAVGWLFYQTLERNKQVKTIPPEGPVKRGVYHVETFVKNNDTLPALLSDTMRWQDFIFENNSGSIKTGDTVFRRIYNRGHFSYVLDTAAGTLGLKKRFTDSVFTHFFRYEIPDSITVRLRGAAGKDSLFIVLKRIKRHFQLSEKQFHWLSESNR